MDERKTIVGPPSLRRGRGATINVTQTEIDNAVPEDSGHCMIAEAVKHSISGIKNVSVDLATIRFTDTKSGVRYTYMTPYYAQQALVQFEEGKKPQPFTFTLSTLFQARPKPLGHKTPTQVVFQGDKSTAGGKSHAQAPVKIGGKPAPIVQRIRRFGLRVLPIGLQQATEARTLEANEND